MDKLIRLRIDHDKIVLIEEWQTKSFMDRHDELDKKVDRLVKQGMDAATAARLVQKALSSSKYSNPLSELFSKIVGDDRPVSGRSSDSDKNVQAQYSTTNMLAMIHYRSPTFVFSLQEKKGLKRKVTIEQQDGEFLFEYSGNDFHVSLKQSVDNSIKLQLFNEDSKQVFQGENYEDLSRKHFEILQRELIPIFESIGFEAPLISTHKSVKDAVRARLVGIHGESNREFQKLIQMLDSDEFAEREKATAQLEQERDKWQIQIQIELENSLPPEVRYRLLSVSQANPSVNVIDSIISSQELLSSTQYLVNLFENSSPKQSQAIAEQLEQLTGFHAGDAKQWKAYFAAQQENTGN